MRRALFMSAAATLFQKLYSIIYKLLAALGAGLVGAVEDKDDIEKI